MLNKICVYCGSSPGGRAEYIEGAKTLAKLFVQREIELVYGGASVGLMGVMADTVLQNGGRVTGIIPEDLVKREVAHNGLTELKVVLSMHERKAQMAELSEGFIALPGGLGTIEELFEVLTWAQLGFHQKPVGILNLCGYYDHLSSFLDHTVSEQFVKPTHRAMLIVEDDPEKLIARFETYESPVVE
ncbi:MAG: TIGR00730 family Rossman fold protein, partial [Calditrichae bacterium]|nr:TIGR00730 family Rossman fold protein [Calditrichia bacterium]